MKFALHVTVIERPWQFAALTFSHPRPQPPRIVFRDAVRHPPTSFSCNYSVQDMATQSALLRVDRLSLTFLVDNTIEWMTKLPPGFKHEIRNQLSNGPPVDVRTGAPFVDLQNYCCGAPHVPIVQ